MAFSFINPILASLFLSRLSLLFINSTLLSHNRTRIQHLFSPVGSTPLIFIIKYIKWILFRVWLSKRETTFLRSGHHQHAMNFGNEVLFLVFIELFFLVIFRTFFARWSRQQRYEGDMKVMDILKDTCFNQTDWGFIMFTKKKLLLFKWLKL